MIIMKQRVISAVLGVILLIFVLCFFNTVFFNVCGLAVYAIALHEILGAYKEKNSIWVFILLLSLGAYVIMYSYIPVHLPLAAVGYAVILAYAFIVVFAFDKVDFKVTSASLLFGLYVLFGIYSIFSVRSVMPHDLYGRDAAFLFVMAAVIAWGGDIFAYFSGYLFGKHKLAPNLSPKKTVEGAVGGVIGSVVCSVRFLWGYSILKPIIEGTSAAYSVTKDSVLVLAVVAFLGSCVGIVGDLFRSAVKRQTGIKDYGNLIPGHGGILDRFDSLLLVAPIMGIASAFIASRGGVFGV